MKTLEQITEILENLSDSELKDLWNDYQGEIRGEQQIYDFDDSFFDEFFSSPGEAARATFFGSVSSWADKYVYFNGYGNIETSSYIIELISLYDLANEIERNQENFDTLLED